MRRGRYTLENDEHVDVVVARSVPTFDGRSVVFEELWERRRSITLLAGVDVQIPDIDGLILMKEIASRPKDLEDIRLLRIRQEEER